MNVIASKDSDLLIGCQEATVVSHPIKDQVGKQEVTVASLAVT